MYHCFCFSAKLLAASEAWRLDLVHSFNSSLVEQRNDLLAPVPLCHSPFFLFTHPDSLPPISLLAPSSASSSLSLLHCISGLLLCRCPFFSEIACLSLSFPLQPPSSLSLSFALCVRVCRWLLLAGSVTRGNWGRVHFNRTNRNKLIHFHCCFWDAVLVSGRRTKSCKFLKKVKA